MLAPSDLSGHLPAAKRYAQPSTQVKDGKAPAAHVRSAAGASRPAERLLAARQHRRGDLGGRELDAPAGLVAVQREGVRPGRKHARDPVQAAAILAVRVEPGAADDRHAPGRHVRRLAERDRRTDRGRVGLEPAVSPVAVAVCPVVAHVRDDQDPPRAREGQPDGPAATNVVVAGSQLLAMLLPSVSESRLAPPTVVALSAVVAWSALFA